MQRDLFTNRLPCIPGLGIPYMGSKRKLAPKIADFILAENPNAKYIFDLFGGGGAMSFEFLQRPQIERVVYNDLDSGVVSLLRDIAQNGVSEKYLQWVDRTTFHERKNGDDWFSGFVKTCWSFGNNCEKGYLFSEENERLKKPLHLAIVERDAKYTDPDTYAKLAKVYAEVRGFIEKPQVAVTTNVQTITNKVMVVRESGSDAEWERKLAMQQASLANAQ